MFKMAGIKIEDIMFWILIFAAIAVIIWKLVGSPTDIGTIIGIGSFILTSEIFVWKKIFSTENKFNSRLSRIDKRTSMGFMKVKHNLNLIENNIMNKLNNIDNRIK